MRVFDISYFMSIYNFLTMITHQPINYLYVGFPTTSLNITNSNFYSCFLGLLTPNLFPFFLHSTTRIF